MEVILNSQVPIIGPTTFLAQAPTHNKHSNEKSNNSMDSQVVVHVSWRYKAKTPYPHLNTLPILVQLPQPMTIKEASSTCS